MCTSLSHCPENAINDTGTTLNWIPSTDNLCAYLPSAWFPVYFYLFLFLYQGHTFTNNRPNTRHWHQIRFVPLFCGVFCGVKPCEDWQRKTTPQRTPQHWRNHAKMDKGQLCSVRRFGHRAVRSQMPQTCASRAIWPPTALWPNLLTKQSWHLSILRCSSSVAGFFAGLFCGVNPRKVWHRKRLHKIRRAGDHNPCRGYHDPWFECWVYCCCCCLFINSTQPPSPECI